MPQKIAPQPSKPAMQDPLIDKVTWLVMTHGFDPWANRVVALYEPHAHCSMTLEAFKTLYMPWWEEEQRKEKSKPTRVYATAAWMLHPARSEIAGIRMRPDRAFPGYTENGNVFKNTYRQPVHENAAQGDIQPFLDFMERFLPAEVERNHWLDWMAHKLLRPEIPGCSIWFVAEDETRPSEGTFGTGRGFMFRILHALLGEAYCKSEDFDILAGTSAQAVYTDWQANCVLVTVNEAHVSPTAYRRGEKRSVYTALKNCIDPAPTRRTFKIKGAQAFDGMSYCSVVIATNHSDAAAIPEDDRRVTVLRNGRAMTPEEGRAMDAWIKAPGNIAALAGYLESSDLSQFDMFAPLDTRAKQEMAERALSQMDDILTDLAEDEEQGLVFPELFLAKRVEEILSGSNAGERIGIGHGWRGQFAGCFEKHCVRVRPVVGPNGEIGEKARVRINGHRHAIYCFRANSARAASLSKSERLAEIAKWGSIDNIQTVLKVVRPQP